MNIRKKALTIAVLFFLSLGSAMAAADKTATAIFAGGCFWSMQHDFENLPGVMQTTVGYTGGDVANPSYALVSSGSTGHYEAIAIVYDKTKTSYEKLLDFYWHDTDPTDANGQFCDKGSEYRPVIFYSDQAQLKAAQKSKNDLVSSKRFADIATRILPAKTFYPAEDYHQHYPDKNPIAYHAYREGCQRDATLSKVWGN